LSHDAGKSWAVMSNPDGKILYSQILSESVIYSVIYESVEDNGTVVSKLSKSYDGGATWALQTTPFYGDRISFFDQSSGIATSNGALQITDDGGSTWKPVLIRPN